MLICILVQASQKSDFEWLGLFEIPTIWELTYFGPFKMWTLYTFKVKKHVLLDLLDKTF